jgi:serine/threonine protein kinase
MVDSAPPAAAAERTRLRGTEELGPYRIVRKIAVGGMAEIYLARQRGIEGLERTVVLKQILEKHEENEEFVTMFLDEARLLAALSHPNIAQVFDLGRAPEGNHYLVMEYVRGPTLLAMLSAAHRAGRQGLPEKPALGIALEIAEALHYVHDRRDDLGRPLGIVHRDLNPANVVVSYDGHVKLIDFGIAKAATKVYETRTGVIKGTYGYIAPEALRGTPPVDRRADVFALGILLYEMLIGKHPFDASDEPRLLDRILEARYKRPREVRPDLPEAMDRLISQCLAPQPEGRPESMATLIDGLTEHMSARGLVPTQSDLAALARELVPDEEGPAPLRRPSSTKSRAPFATESATRPALALLGAAAAPEGGRESTRKVATPARTSVPPPPPPPAPPSRISRPPPPPVEALVAGRRSSPPAPPSPSAPPFPTAASASASSVPPRSAEEKTDPGTPRPALIDDGTDSAEVTRVTGAQPEFDDEPSTVPGVSSPIRIAMEIAAAHKRSPTARLEDTLNLRLRARRNRLRAVGAACGVVVAGMLAFAAGRAIGVARPDPSAAGETSTARALHVVSDPPGATIAIDGAELGMRTPAVIAIDPRLPQVRIDVALPGYAPGSLSVSSASGEARFVLTPIAVAQDR